jgi:hypothetical protein
MKVLQTAAVGATSAPPIWASRGWRLRQAGLHWQEVLPKVKRSAPEPTRSRKEKHTMSRSSPPRGGDPGAQRPQPAEGAFGQALDTQQVLDAVKPFVKG